LLLLIDPPVFARLEPIWLLIIRILEKETTEKGFINGGEHD
jgi:hypothetical protein